MKPYYEHAGITIYHADCRDVLPTLEAVDLVLTDPPYNAQKDYGAASDDLPEDEYEDFMRQVVSDCVRLAPKQAWVSPRYKNGFFLPLFKNPHLIVVRRGASGPFRQGWSDQFETVITVGKPSRCVPDLWDDIRLKGEGYFFTEETYGHPGYTPFPLMKRLASLLCDETLVDPFSGTGTALRAAKDLGRRAIGVEIEEKYCEIAALRLQQEVLL